MKKTSLVFVVLLAVSTAVWSASLKITVEIDDNLISSHCSNGCSGSGCVAPGNPGSTTTLRPVTKTTTKPKTTTAVTTPNYPTWPYTPIWTTAGGTTPTQGAFTTPNTTPSGQWTMPTTPAPPSTTSLRFPTGTIFKGDDIESTWSSATFNNPVFEYGTGKISSGTIVGGNIRAYRDVTGNGEITSLLGTIRTATITGGTLTAGTLQPNGSYTGVNINNVVLSKWNFVIFSSGTFSGSNTGKIVNSTMGAITSGTIIGATVSNHTIVNGHISAGLVSGQLINGQTSIGRIQGSVYDAKITSGTTSGVVTAYDGLFRGNITNVVLSEWSVGVYEDYYSIAEIMCE